MPKVVHSTGVYCWTNKVNGKVYVGSTMRSFKARRHETLLALKRGKCHNRHLQAAWNRYGESAFGYIILERCRRDKCVEREQWWINRFDSADPKKGYNLCPTAGVVYGYKHTPESIRNMSAAAKARKITQKGREALTVCLKKRWDEPGFKERMKKVHSRRYTDPVEKQKLVEMNKLAVLARIGSTHTEEAKKKISDRTKERMSDPELRARLRASSKRRWDRWRAEQQAK